VYGDEGDEGDEGDGEGVELEENYHEVMEMLVKGERREGQGAPKGKRQKQ
jgi:hypothetical protein